MLYYRDNLDSLRRQQKFPRLQLRTAKELMEGEGIERLSSAASTDETFKKARESNKIKLRQTNLEY